MTSLRCVSDVYDRVGAVAYDDAHDFLAMCLAVFGEEPVLREHNGRWYDEDDVLVLVPDSGEQAC